MSIATRSPYPSAFDGDASSACSTNVLVTNEVLSAIYIAVEVKRDLKTRL